MIILVRLFFNSILLQNILLCRKTSLPSHRKLTKGNLCFFGNDGITHEYHSPKLRPQMCFISRFN